MNLDCGFTEEWAVDYVQGRLRQLDELRYRKHLLACPECAQLARDWQDTLSLPVMAAGRPSNRLYWRLLAVLLLRGAGNRVREHRRAIGLAMCGLLFLLMGTGLVKLYVFGSGTQDQASMLVAGNEPYISGKVPGILENVTFIQRPDTQKYRLIELGHSGLSGYVWVNRQSNEAYILVSGHAPGEGRHYRAWIVSNAGRSQGDDMLWNGASAQLYMQGGDWREAQGVIISRDMQSVPLNAPSSETDPSFTDALYANLSAGPSS